MSRPPPSLLQTFPIVAIGASAGGLEAMVEFLQFLPANTGMAFIYVQHLSPDHKSLLSEILAKKTDMQVQEIDNMDQITPNNLYIIPYNKGIEVSKGRIKLIPRADSSTAISIDVLFASLAQAQQQRVIGIVLSGSASDGTLGIKAIKSAGGLTFAQDDSAKFTSMPHSAIATGMVDYILSPKDIAMELARLSKQPLRKSKKSVAATPAEDKINNHDPDLRAILQELYKSTGVDFSAYKINTIKRRILRRMLQYKIKTLQQYAVLLREKQEETSILYQDLLINVTSFFRDTDTHKYLRYTLFPKLLKRKHEGDTLRLWVPACATGEEAYSLAMILLEIQENSSSSLPIQIFATDLSEQAIAKARLGVYSQQELESVSPKRLQRFFSKTEGGFRVNKALRDMCVFAPHNILRDSPFSRLDFISCCNLFIYLDTAAQKKAVNTFHYALHADGYLMLGKSENISHSSHLFTISSNIYKIFARKINSGAQRLPELAARQTHTPLAEKHLPLPPQLKAQPHTPMNQQWLDNAIDTVLVSEFMPASVVVNHQLEIVQFRGSTELYLSHPKGRATFNILKMARPELAFELRNGLNKAIKNRQRIQKSGIEVKWQGELKLVGFEIVPLSLEWNEPLVLVIFNEQSYPEMSMLVPGEKPEAALESAKDRKIKRLEEELAAAHADAMAFSQEQEAITEELQSAHEEVVSSNEELQTLNEELETSKEEIESANEELTTTNQELQTRNDLLSESYEYSNAIVATMHEPMLVLGNDLRVRSANKAFYKNFGVNEQQTEGVMLYDLGNKQWNIPALRKLLEDIIPKNAQFYNYEVKHTFLNIGEKIMSLNASRVIQKTHREQLILLVISDITEVRRLIVEKELIEKELLNKEIRERKTEKLKLEKAVNQRTQELKEANAELEEKNTDLLNVNKELEAFAYVSSHDLQEPLRKLQMFAGIILENEQENLSEKGKGYFSLMQQSAGRMQRLIQDLLAFSRVSVAERQFVATDLSLLIEEVKADFKEAITQQKAQIVVQEVCEVYVVPFQFRQLLHNMISNALKFADPTRPPRITIHCRTAMAEKLKVEGLAPLSSYCHISISDNGIGFEQHFSNKIFEVFQKLHGREEYAGTGIGLAIVKKIIDNHHGLVNATSELNKGTTFNLYIPSVPKSKAK
jgi:two-component system, chemotaxis family, CheB/CheR fusion protein